MAEKLNELLPNVVVMGGGTGASTVIRGLSPDFGSKVTGVISVADDGGNTKFFRDEFGAYAQGDLRQAMVAQLPQGRNGETEEAIENAEFIAWLMEYRFEEGVSGPKGLTDMNVGNLLGMLATEYYDGDPNRGFNRLAKIFGVKGRTLPVTLHKPYLRTTTADGRVIDGEHELEMSGESSLMGAQMEFRTGEAVINPLADEAIRSADVVTWGPGSLYTSLGAMTPVKGLREALVETDAAVVMAVNLVNKERMHTVGFRVSDYPKELERLLGARVIDYVLFNDEPFDEETSASYAAEDSYPVEIDHDEIINAGYEPVGAPLLSRAPIEKADPRKDKLADLRSVARHDPIETARALIDIAWSHRRARK